jgi:phytoene dehydrogenase-like protein
VASTQASYDAVVVGSGPNGLAGAIVLAQAGLSVLVVERADTIGGGTRSAELTLPGFVHDVCSAVHPMAAGSPFLRTLPLAQHGLEWIDPPAALAHPFDDGTAITVKRSIASTADEFGASGDEYLNLMVPLVEDWPDLEWPLLGSLSFPKNPLALARFGATALCPASRFSRKTFSTSKARAVFAGIAAHSVLPMERIPSASFGLVLGTTAHAFGWPFPRGGAQRIADSLASYFRSLGGEIVTGTTVQSLDQLPPSRAVLCDVSPKQLLEIAGTHLPDTFRRLLARYAYGPGACKLDWALDEPIPWKSPACLTAGTIHLGASLEEIEVSERAPWQGTVAEKPFVLLAQPTLFDPTRAPVGKHIAWAYCHVPNGSSLDVADRIEQQIERFAPGFRQRILKRHVATAANLESYNPNLIGGDFSGGSAQLDQLLARPTWRRYRTPLRNLYLCSASTPPSGGVHGMCGYWAAQAALKDHFS